MGGELHGGHPLRPATPPTPVRVFDAREPAKDRPLMFRHLPVVARALLPGLTPSNQDPYPRHRVNENRIQSPEHLPFDQ